MVKENKKEQKNPNEELDESDNDIELSEKSAGNLRGELKCNYTIKK